MEVLYQLSYPGAVDNFSGAVRFGALMTLVEAVYSSTWTIRLASSVPR